MDCETRWLKEDLGLVHMCEADLNSLKFHPRHGSVCRKLLEFLVKSTLCARKYPDVYAQEEYDEAMSIFNSKQVEKQSAIKELSDTTRNYEDEEREQNFLTQRLECLKKVQYLQKTSSEALQEIADRPNLGIEQVRYNIDRSSEYLSSNPLEKLYSPLAEFTNPEPGITNRHISLVDDEFSNCKQKIKVLFEAIAKVHSEVEEKIGTFGHDLQTKKTNLDKLIAIQAPDVEEVILDLDEDERELKTKNTELISRITELDREIRKMQSLYESRSIKIVKQSQIDVDKYLFVLEAVENLEHELLYKENNFDKTTTNGQ